MKVLLLSYYFPPDKAVGGLRARKVAETLREAGHEVTVIAAGAPESGLSDPVRVKPLPSIRDLYNFLKSRRLETESGDSSIESAVRRSGGKSGHVAHWKRWTFSLIWLPDDKQGFILPVIWKALRLHGGRPDLIYTTAPPFSVHLSGLILRVLTGSRWVAEFRDPWTTNPWKPAELRSAFSDWLGRKLEWLCLERADLLVTVSDGIASRLVETGTTTPIAIVRNGIQKLRTPEEVQADIQADGPFEIVYTGSFYHSRDPFPFLAAVKQMVADSGFSPADLRVRFIGATREYEGRSIGDYLREEGLDDYVKLEGWMRPEQSLRHVHAAGVLLLLAVDQPDQVPNKLYEYLGARRPILAVADEGGETARMLELVGGHHIVPVNDASYIRQALERLIREGSCDPVGHSGVLQGWTTSTQMGMLRAALEA